MKLTRKIKNIFTLAISALCCLFMGVALLFAPTILAKAAHTTKPTTTDAINCVGASIRIDEDGENGIRFRVRISCDENGNVSLGESDSYTSEEFANATKGILITVPPLHRFP